MVSSALKMFYSLFANDFVLSFTIDGSDSFLLFTSQSVIAKEVITKLRMEGTVNGHAFTIEGKGKADPYK